MCSATEASELKVVASAAASLAVEVTAVILVAAERAEAAVDAPAEETGVVAAVVARLAAQSPALPILQTASHMPAAVMVAMPSPHRKPPRSAEEGA